MQIEDDILTLVAQGAYLDAARLLQSRRGITLDEAAAEIDRFRHEITPLDPDAAPGHPAADPITPAIAEAIRSGLKLEAIKLYRQAHGVGLKEAKDAVDAHEVANRGESRSAAPKPPIHPGLLNVEPAMNDEDTAILHRVILDSRHLAQSRTLHFEGGERVERAARIDLVRMGCCFYLLHYDKEGNELTDTCHDTENEAMNQAEYEFGIRTADWLRMPSSGA